jgi:hypothetical protein
MQIEGNATAVLVMLVALLIGGLISLLIAIRLTYQLTRRMWRGRVTEGLVTRHIDVGSGGEDSALQTEVKFTDPDAGVMRTLSRGRQYPAGFKIGARVRVAYVAGEPRDARIVEELRTAIVWLGVLGTTLTLVAGMLLLDVWPTGQQ